MFFPYDGHQIWFDCHGSGTPLILLHGNTASSSMFDPIIPLLADKYQVITLDFLGCGQSDHLPSWPADLWYEWAKQVNALCRYIGFCDDDDDDGNGNDGHRRSSGPGFPATSIGASPP